MTINTIQTKYFISIVDYLEGVGKQEIKQRVELSRKILSSLNSICEDKQYLGGC